MPHNYDDGKARGAENFGRSNMNALIKFHELLCANQRQIRFARPREYDKLV